MPLDTLNADHIGQIGGGFEPQRQNTGQIFITGLAGNENNIVTLSLLSVSIPKSNVSIIEIPYLNQIRKFAGKMNFEDMTLVVNDYVDQNTKKVVSDWFYLTHNPRDGKTAFASQYKKNGRIVLYAPDGTGDREWECQGMWISNYDPGDIDMEADAQVRITCTVTIDKALFLPSVDSAA